MTFDRTNTTKDGKFKAIKCTEYVSRHDCTREYTEDEITAIRNHGWTHEYKKRINYYVLHLDTNEKEFVMVDNIKETKKYIIKKYYNKDGE